MDTCFTEVRLDRGTSREHTIGIEECKVSEPDVLASDIIENLQSTLELSRTAISDRKITSKLK